jgi:hypothetical protein
MAAATMGSSKILAHEADGPFSETWAVLCSHRLDPGVAQQSVTPGFLPGAGGLAWGLAFPGQSSTWRILLRFTEAGTGGCGEVDRVARSIARKPSPKPEIVRRVTGDQGHPSSCDGHRVDLDAVQRSRYIAMGCSRIRQAQLSHWIQPGHRSRTRP